MSCYRNSNRCVDKYANFIAWQKSSPTEKISVSLFYDFLDKRAIEFNYSIAIFEFWFLLSPALWSRDVIKSFRFRVDIFFIINLLEIISVAAVIDEGFLIKRSEKVNFLPFLFIHFYDCACPGIIRWLCVLHSKKRWQKWLIRDNDDSSLQEAQWMIFQFKITLESPSCSSFVTFYRANTEAIFSAERRINSASQI